MIRTILPRLFAFDIEWVPDPEAAKRLFGVDTNTVGGIEDAFRKLWADRGATEETPHPFLKLTVSRIVSICGIYREHDTQSGEVSLKLVSLPSDPLNEEQQSEIAILNGINRALSDKRPQLIGFNSQRSDLPIIINRSIVHGLSSFGWAMRPEKPWEGADYFSTHGDHHLDLATMLGWGLQMPTLHEAATCSGIPGKIDVAGASVAEMWLKGDVEGIVNYNEFDAFTTYLLWARMAHFSTALSEEAYVHEQQLVEELLEREIGTGKTHLEKYLEVWKGMKF
ncbi:MAG: 3'-5' exonuclease [Opitutales bacterium]|nr:3'-5' exonuclease [Opitutales bacterium]